METANPSIPEWFKNRNVLISGGTGFMGKVLIVKLLMECPDIGNLFLMIREKKGVDPQLRLTSIVQQEPFRKLRDNYAERLKKLVVISGDTAIDGLGLSEPNRERLVKEVSVVFHMAANVKFDMPLRTAVAINAKGTANILTLAKQMPRLKSFIHVSTAYSQCGEAVLEERAYPVPISPKNILSAVESMNDEILKTITPKLLGKQPNTYAFSKALSEDLVANCGLPAGVARPSIVTASWKEPVPGWIENMNGPTGLMIGAGKGVIRSMLCNSEYLTDLIPCDMAVNAVIALAWNVGIENPEKPIFMNVTESGENPISWGHTLETGKKHALANPFSGPLWYPGGNITSSKLRHWFCVIFFHILPAYFLDTLMMLSGNKPFLVRIQGRVSSGLELLQYYTTKQWIFRNDTKKALEQRLCPEDRKRFFMDTKALSWDDYLLNYILGTRKYCLKDDPSTLPRARRVFTYLYIADICIRLVFGLFLMWLIYSWLMPRKMITTLINNDEI